MLDVVNRTGGAIEDVSDDEVIEGIKLLARTEGIFAETAGGVTVAVLRKLLAAGLLDPEAETVIFNTGDGLKTLDAIADVVGPTATIPPTLAAFDAHRPGLTELPDRCGSRAVAHGAGDATSGWSSMPNRVCSACR